MGTPARLMSGRRLTTTAAIALALGTVALLVAACSGASGPGVASLGSSTTKPAASKSSLSAQRLAYAKCMRTHGVPNFPDPDANGGFQLAVHNIDFSSPRFVTANKACTHLLPYGGRISPSAMAQIATAALKFSMCMRTHGVLDYPDPTILDQSMGAGMTATVGWKGGNINTNSATYKRADRVCEPPFIKATS